MKKETPAATNAPNTSAAIVKKENPKEYDYDSTIKLIEVIQEVLPMNDGEWDIVEEKYNKWSIEHSKVYRKKGEIKKKYQRLHLIKMAKLVQSMLSREEARTENGESTNATHSTRRGKKKWNLVVDTKQWKQSRKNINHHSPTDMMRRQAYESGFSEINRNYNTQFQNYHVSSSIENLAYQQQEKMNQVQSQIIILQQMSMQIQQQLRDADTSLNRLMQTVFSFARHSSHSNGVPLQSFPQPMVLPSTPRPPESPPNDIKQKTQIQQPPKLEPLPPLPPMPHSKISLKSKKTSQYTPQSLQTLSAIDVSASNTHHTQAVPIRYISKKM